MNIIMALGALLASIPKDKLDALIDLVEAAIADSDNKYDDTYVLPVIKAARILLEIPDNAD